MNIKRKYQDSRDPGTINADDEVVESLFYDDKANDNFNLNDFIYTNAYDYLIPDNVFNILTNIYKLWKVIVFITIEESFSFI